MAQNDLMSNAEDVADQVREQKALPGKATCTLYHEDYTDSLNKRFLSSGKSMCACTARVMFA